jgi:hypothetical protein
MKRLLFVLLFAPILLMAQGQISIPIVDVKVGEEISIPVTITDIPDNLTSFEIIVETDVDLLEFTGVNSDESMIDGKMFFCNFSPVVHNWQDGSVSTSWKSPYHAGRMIVVCADAYPLGGELMFNILGVGKTDGKVSVYVSYLLLNTDVKFGKKPSMISID